MAAVVGRVLERKGSFTFNIQATHDTWHETQTDTNTDPRTIKNIWRANHKKSKYQLYKIKLKKYGGNFTIEFHIPGKCMKTPTLGVVSALGVVTTASVDRNRNKKIILLTAWKPKILLVNITKVTFGSHILYIQSISIRLVGVFFFF